MLLLFPFTVLHQLLFRLIDKNSQDNHRAHGNELPERINAQEDQTILDNCDDQRADHRADDGPLTPKSEAPPIITAAEVPSLAGFGLHQV